uniref:Uncharacterized protein n=1 Tax=Panagrolaimus sp. PS1159 TaxID=55785 RepID=A0AC35F3B5_9BILA
MGSVRDRIAIFESLKEKESETKTDERRESITLPAAVEAGIVGAAVATFDHMTTAVSKQEEDEHTHEDESLNAENSPLHEKIKTQNFKKGDMSEVYDERRTQPDTHEDIAMQTIESINLETKPEEKSYIQQISEKKEIYTIPQSISETFNQTYTEDQLQTDNASPVNHPNLETKVLQIPTEIDEVALNKESDIKATIKEQLTAENTPETELIEKEKAKAQNKEKDKQGDKMENEQSSSDCATTKFAGESSELQKSDEITEEPLQQRPVDIPYPEEKDEGPGLATKIAGAVAGVTVGGAILAYNKVKDAIGGNDEESEYPSEHETPEAHYFEEREQIMHESEFPPTYDEATKIQISEEEHADPYLIQAKHEGGFEQSDENLTREENASPERREGSSSYNYATKLETHKDENDDSYLIRAGNFFTETSNEDVTAERQGAEEGDALEITTSAYLFSKQSKSEQLQNVSTTDKNNYLNEKDVVPDRPQTPMEIGTHEVVEEAEVSSLSTESDQHSSNIKEHEKSIHEFKENIFIERNEPSESAEFQGISEINDKQVEKQQPSTQSAGDAEQARLYEQEQSSHGESTEDEVQTTTDTNIASQTEETVQKENLDRGEHVKQEFEAQQSYEQPTSQQQSEHADPYLLHTKSENQIEEYNSEQVALGYPETTFEEETEKLQKSGEIAEEPLQQRPVDIPYPEDRD